MEEATYLKQGYAPFDLKWRLVRYRSRVASEGRTRDLREIDQAIEEEKQTKPALGGA